MIKYFLHAFLFSLAIIITGPIITIADQSPAAYVEVFDFGTVKTGVVKTHVFNIPNNSGKPFHIEKATTSDKSVQVLSYPVEVPEGKGAAMKVRWIPTGKMESEIILETAEALPVQPKFLLKGDVKGQTPHADNEFTRQNIPDELITRKLKARDLRLCISAEAALKEMKSNRTITFVDVRDPQSFERCRIPGSINIPLYSVKSKPFLASMTIILVNDGASYGPLEKECRQLRDSGRVAWILGGGLSEWKNKKGPIQGDALSGMNLVAPAAYFTERGFEDWIVLYACKSRASLAHFLLPESVPVPESTDGADFISKMKAQLATLGANDHSYILFVNDDGKDYGNFEKLILQTGAKNTFYLQGGIAAYESFLKQQAVLLGPNANSKKVFKKCASCP